MLHLACVLCLLTAELDLWLLYKQVCVVGAQGPEVKEHVLLKPQTGRVPALSWCSGNDSWELLCISRCWA
jgi:hypothetical protein